jgi:FkbM family methyltransferase
MFKYYIGRLLVALFRLKGFSYSHLNEDNIIDWLTGYKKTGTYVDVGANNPELISNTRLFYERGWSGVNIEPTEREYNLLEEKRKRDKNYNCAVGKGEKIFYEGGDGNSAGNTMDSHAAAERGFQNKRVISLRPLSEILDESGLTSITFMTMDIEGFEHEALKTNNWTKYRPEVLCIEGSGYSFLKQYGYRWIFWDGLNSYYKRIKE